MFGESFKLMIVFGGAWHFVAGFDWSLLPFTMYSNFTVRILKNKYNYCYFKNNQFCYTYNDIIK